MSLEQVVGGRTYTAVVSCTEGAKQVSRKTMTLSLDGREHVVSIVAWVWGGNIFLKFYDGKTALWADTQPYVLVPTWDATTLPDRTIDLREPTSLDQADSPNPLLHYPVERDATPDATIVAKFRAVGAVQ